MTTSFRTVRLVYVGVILVATLSGLGAELDLDLVRANLLGGVRPSLDPRDAIDGIRNLALFGGWGLLWVMTGPGRELGRRVLEATLTGAALSLGIEAIQLFSPVRHANVLDVVTNTGGALVGAVAAVGLARAVQGARDARSFVGMPAFLLAGFYGAAAALEAFLPLFEVADPAGAGGPLSRMERSLALFQWSSLGRLPLLNFVLFVPAGGFAVAALVERGAAYRRAWPRVAALGVTLAVLLEVAGGAVSYPIIAGSALVNGAAVALGAWLAARWLPPFSREVRGRDRPLLLLLAYAVLVLLWSWRPFLPEPSLEALLAQLSPERLVPLRAHGMRFEVFSVVDPLRQFCLAFPVGALLAVWPLRKKGWLAGALPGVYLTAAVEVGQLFIGGRLFDVTDLLVGVSAVLLGWLVVRRCAFPVHGEVWPAGKGAG